MGWRMRIYAMRLFYGLRKKTVFRWNWPIEVKDSKTFSFVTCPSPSTLSKLLFAIPPVTSEQFTPLTHSQKHSQIMSSEGDPVQIQV